MVAVSWQFLIARQTSARVPLAENLILALSVWVIYMSDRFLDAWLPKSGAVSRERHYFCGRHRASVLLLILAATAVTLWLSSASLAVADLRAGLRLASVILAYMFCVHAGKGLAVARALKEFAVGFLFAAGVALPSWAHGPRFSFQTWVALGFFALLCSLNCLTIECLERPAARARRTCSLSVRWAAARLNSLSAVVALAAFFLALRAPFSPPHAAGLLSVSAGAALLLALRVFRGHFSLPALRVLADLALILPAAAALLSGLR